MTPQEFYVLLQKHDWTHEMSDDQRVWLQGRDQYAKIKAALNKHPEFEPLFLQYEGWAWRKDGFTKPEMPKSEGKLLWKDNSTGNGQVAMLGRWSVAGYYWNSLRAKSDPDHNKYRADVMLPGYRNTPIFRATPEDCKKAVEKTVETWLEGAGL